MKKLGLIMLASILMAGVVQGAIPKTAFAQASAEVKVYSSAPANPAERPWVGSNTPWTYYNDDWFYKGTLYYDYGDKEGWAPYYSYESKTVTRPSDYYSTKYTEWYQSNPQYTETLIRERPYWKEHHVGNVYNENFYITHDKGEGENRWRKAWRDIRHDKD